MGIRDQELIAALAGNQEKYTIAYNRLMLYAKSKARDSFPFSDYSFREDIVERAMDKFASPTWITASTKAKHPWAYAEKTIRDSVIDSLRANIGKFDSTSLSVSEDEGFGFHGVKVNEKRSCGINKTKQSKSKNTMGILSKLLRIPWWWENRNIIVNKSEKLRLLTSTISNQKEKTILKHYLFGFKKVEIGRELGVSKPYITQRINYWQDIWGWGKTEVEQARLILLTQYLADCSPLVFDRIRLYPTYDPEELENINYGEYVRVRGKQAKKQFCDIITSNPRTAAYFNDLEESQLEDLFPICYLCLKYWYADWSKQDLS